MSAYSRMVHIRKWTEKYITVEGDGMTDNYGNATREDLFFLCVPHINKSIKFRASSSWNLFHWIAQMC